MVVWNSTVIARDRVEVPVSVDKLCSRLKLLSIDDIPVVVYDSPHHMTLNFGLRSSSFNAFFELGGVLLSCSLSKQWHMRDNVLFDEKFWRLWDAIVTSGWKSVSMSSFRSVYGCDGADTYCFIPLLPFSDVDGGLVVDELCYHSVGYSLLRDVVNLFKHFVSTRRWCFGSVIKLTGVHDSQFLEYQICLLDLMISRYSKPFDILELLLDLNLWGVGHSSLDCYIGLIAEDDSLHAMQHNAMMLVMRSSLIFSVTSCYLGNIIKHCNIDSTPLISSNYCNIQTSFSS